MFGFYPVVDGFAPMFATVLINLPVFADQKKDINYDQKLHLSHFRPSNQNGFTLIEIMSVLIIMGVMASLVLTKWHIIYDSASLTALKVGVREINTREFLEWSKIKISETGYTNDLEVYNAVDKDLGPGYRWQPLPTITNGTLHYDSEAVSLNRIGSTRKSAGQWN